MTHRERTFLYLLLADATADFGGHGWAMTINNVVAVYWLILAIVEAYRWLTDRPVRA